MACFECLIPRFAKNVAILINERPSLRAVAPNDPLALISLRTLDFDWVFSLTQSVTLLTTEDMLGL